MTKMVKRLGSCSMRKNIYNPTKANFNYFSQRTCTCNKFKIFKIKLPILQYWHYLAFFQYLHVLKRAFYLSLGEL